MTRYLLLLRFTEQGVKAVDRSPARAAQFRDVVAAAGGNVSFQFWTTGQWDGCALLETPDEQTAASLVLGLGKAGNVRTQTMRVFDEQEFKSIAEKL